LARVLDRLDRGVILTNGSGQPMLLNAPAERIIAEDDGLSLDAAGLVAATSAATRQLREAIVAMGRDIAADVRHLRLSRPSHRLPLWVTLLPLWRLGVMAPGTGTPRVAVFITEPDAPLVIARTMIADTFRLTGRETDLAVLLAEGLDLETIAARLGLGRSTVRVHLKHVFDKTGVRSQPALVALLRGFSGRLH
jgi:DNA-binding CsgD family transcriptional regulator